MLSKPTVKRLIIYNRILKDLYRNGHNWATSNTISNALSNKPAQVRKDISFLVNKGKPGVGYDIKGLIDDIDALLGLKHTWGIMLVGAGNLGRALFHYPGFKKQGFEFRMVVDNDPGKISKKWGILKICSPKNITEKTIKENDIAIAVISVPQDVVQEAAQRVVNAGVREILNFAPVTLSVPSDVNVRYADLTLQLENLSYSLSSRKLKKK